MQVLFASVRVVFALAFCLIFIDAPAKAGPVEVETDAGVVTMVATVETIDATRQVVTLVGPHNNWVVVKVGPEHLKLIKLKEKITISYADEVAVALRKVDNPQPGNIIEQEETSGMNMNPETVAEQDWVEATPSGATDLTTIEITDTVAAITATRAPSPSTAPAAGPAPSRSVQACRVSIRSRSGTGLCSRSPARWLST